jgi:hypothetical protein
MVDPVNFFPLAGAECFVGIQAPDAFEQTLPSQNFMQTRDTACELLGHVKERRVAIGHFHISLQEALRNRPAGVCCGATFVQQLRGTFRPNGPVAQQASNDAALL